MRERRSPRGAALCLRNRWPGRSGGRGGRQRRRRRPFRGGTRGCYANSDHGQRRGRGRWKRTGQDGCGDREPTVGRKREASAGAREEEVGEVASAEKGEAGFGKGGISKWECTNGGTLFGRYVFVLLTNRTRRGYSRTRYSDLRRILEMLDFKY
ncbi:hypothetical protein GW17_00016670 [Ensete ventricosum]|nr:hypothetical protein GW17_00016670 [Ensete ventricosum]